MVTSINSVSPNEISMFCPDCSGSLPVDFSTFTLQKKESSLSSSKWPKPEISVCKFQREEMQTCVEKYMKMENQRFTDLSC